MVAQGQAQLFACMQNRKAKDTTFYRLKKRQICVSKEEFPANRPALGLCDTVSRSVKSPA